MSGFFTSTILVIAGNMRCALKRARRRKINARIPAAWVANDGHHPKTAVAQGLLSHDGMKCPCKRRICWKIFVTQQMRWTQRGAHLLLQTRVQVLNDDLRKTFGRWFPGMREEA